MKKTITAKEICQICGIGMKHFYTLKQDEVIPPADDMSRTPYLWRTDNPRLLEFFQARNKIIDFEQFIA